MASTVPPLPGEWCARVNDPWVSAHRERLEREFALIREEVARTLGVGAARNMDIATFARYAKQRESTRSPPPPVPRRYEWS